MDLPSQYLLLATRDESGRMIGMDHVGLAGAVLAELALEGAIELTGKKVSLLRPPTDSMLQPLWDEMKADKPRSATAWVQRLGGRRLKAIRASICERLAQEGVWKAEKGFFRTKYVSVNPEPEDALRAEIIAAVEKKDASNERLVCLVVICQAAQSTAELHHDRKKRKEIKLAAKEWVKSDEFGKAVGDVVKAIHGASAAAVVVAT